jgi:pyruvate dehydrogenase E2 component (dihydrolipoamide acetyltransferase)
MPSLLHLPGLAAGTTDATLLEWLVAENAPFSATTTIVTLETDKAVVDIVAEADGVILRRLVPVGAEVAVGQAIALLGTPDETLTDVDGALMELGVAQRLSSGEQPQAARSEMNPAATGGAPAPVRGDDVSADPPRLFASPLARRLAKDAGLVLEELRGTGPNGRIMRQDVATTLAGRSGAPQPVANESTEASYTERPHSRSRKAIAARLSQSQQTVPHFYLRAVVRVDKLLRLRTHLNGGASVRITLNDLVLKAVAGAHLRVPAMNVIWTPDAIRQFSSVDVALAVATAEGLVAPAVRGVDRLTVTGVATATRDLAERARTGRLQQHELEGGSITVTNLGMFGTREFAAIVNPPHASILAVGAAAAEPVAKKGKVVLAQTMRVTLSVDHRPVDGATAAQWMQSFVSLIEDPLQIVA